MIEDAALPVMELDGLLVLAGPILGAMAITIGVGFTQIFGTRAGSRERTEPRLRRRERDIFAIRTRQALNTMYRIGIPTVGAAVLALLAACRMAGWVCGRVLPLGFRWRGRSMVGWCLARASPGATYTRARRFACRDCFAQVGMVLQKQCVREQSCRQRCKESGEAFAQWSPVWNAVKLVCLITPVLFWRQARDDHGWPPMATDGH